jgi:molybdopterin/thiamine biosynthesis adenylyltransferase
MSGHDGPRSEMKLGDKHVVVVGSGGNIGSHVVPHLGRMPRINRVTLIDKDVYEPRNLLAQDIVPSDVGKPKAIVQARRLRRIRPGIRVDAVYDAAENLPLGRFRSDVILAGVDSRRARQVVTEKSWQLRVVYADAGVDGERLLARVSVYYPGRENGCHQCNWYPADYEAVEQEYPCAVGGRSRNAVETPATNAPSSLGALAASLLALECQKILDGATVDDGAGRELLLDASGGNLYSNRLVYHRECRMPEHRRDPIGTTEACPGTTTLAELLARATGRGTGNTPSADAMTLRVAGQPFVTHLTCENCGDRDRVLRLKASLRPAQRFRCRRCAGHLIATGFDTADEIDLHSLSRRVMGFTLRSIGIRDGDVLRVGAGGGSVRFFEVNSAPDAAVAAMHGRRANSAKREKPKAKTRRKE